jgi:hypothetical protein
MLWYKAWLESRWRFITGLLLLTCSAAGIVLTRPELVKLITAAPAPDFGGELGRKVKEALELSRSYRGYVWSHWFGQNAAQLATLFAVILGTGGLLPQTSGGASLFTLSMPVSRERLVGVRAATGLMQWFVLAFVPSLAIPLLSPAIGESYTVSDALAHSLFLFVAGTVFFAIALTLSTVFGDIWRPLTITLCLAIFIDVLEDFAHVPGIGIFRLMTGEDYFRHGAIPWLGLLASAVASTAMLWAAATNLTRRDF